MEMQKLSSARKASFGQLISAIVSTTRVTFPASPGLHRFTCVLRPMVLAMAPSQLKQRRMAVHDACPLHSDVFRFICRYTLEPSDWHFEEEQTFNHVLHAYSDHVRAGPMNSSTCQTMDAPPLSVDQDEDATQQFARMRRAAFDTSRTACDVVCFELQLEDCCICSHACALQALVADYQFFSTVGSSSVSTTIEKLTLAFAV